MRVIFILIRRDAFDLKISGHKQLRVAVRKIFSKIFMQIVRFIRLSKPTKIVTFKTNWLQIFSRYCSVYHKWCDNSDSESYYSEWWCISCVQSFPNCAIEEESLRKSPRFKQLFEIDFIGSIITITHGAFLVYRKLIDMIDILKQLQWLCI